MVSGVFVCRYNFLLLAEKLPMSSISCLHLTNHKSIPFSWGTLSSLPLTPPWIPGEVSFLFEGKQTQRCHTFPLLDGGCSLVKNNPFPSSMTTAFYHLQTLFPSALLTICSRTRGPTFLARQEFSFCVSKSCTSFHRLSSLMVFWMHSKARDP